MDNFTFITLIKIRKKLNGVFPRFFNIISPIDFSGNYRTFKIFGIDRRNLL